MTNNIKWGIKIEHIIYSIWKDGEITQAVTKSFETEAEALREANQMTVEMMKNGEALSLFVAEKHSEYPIYG